MAIVISNASPLIGLCGVKMLHILKDLWGQIIIPDAVYKEVVVQGAGRYGVDSIAKACGDWINVVSVKDKQEVDALQAILDEGESEVITLGQELNADLLIIDNREPRLFAAAVNLKVVGTVGVIKLAWQKGLIIEPVDMLNRLRINGFWISDQLMERIISEILK